MIPKLTCMCAFVSCVLAAAVSQAATIALPANGNLQAAINSALPGDVITLPAGAIYVGNFVLPAKTNPNGLPITIKSAANPVMLPAAGQRILPGHAVLLPKIKSPNANPRCRRQRTRDSGSCNISSSRRPTADTATSSR